MNLFKKLEERFEEINYKEFYRDIFPVGSFQKEDINGKGIDQNGIYNGIAIAINQKTKKIKRYTITDDLKKLDDLVESNDFCLMSPISYIGKSRKSDNARYLYALAIDLDGVDTEKNWDFLMEQIENGHNMLSFVWGLPKPTYIVSSGTGLHLYYVFNEPIPLFKNIVDELVKLRTRITWQAWTQGSSSLHDSVQYESLYQGFRIVGTITKNGKRAKAYKVGDKVTIEYLNKYVPETYRIKDLKYKSKLSKEKAKLLYPEWYQRRIENKQPRNSWRCKEDLYYWWIRRLKEGAEQGHRYWCIMTLATYAIKSGIPFEVLEKDAFKLLPLMNERGDAFTEDDVIHALEAYNDSYITYPIHTIVTRTGIKIEKNKRNGRKRTDHLQAKYWINDKGRREINSCRQNRELALQDMRENGEIKGRPKGSTNKNYPKAEIIKKWREKNPEGRKIDCQKETGISKPTILKWWDTEITENKLEKLKLMITETRDLSYKVFLKILYSHVKKHHYILRKIKLDELPLLFEHSKKMNRVLGDVEEEDKSFEMYWESYIKCEIKFDIKSCERNNQKCDYYKFLDEE